MKASDYAMVRLGVRVGRVGTALLVSLHVGSILDTRFRAMFAAELRRREDLER